MKHLDLFSGIGGFALATESVWPEADHRFCDNEPFSQAILRKHWPNAKIYGDIRQLTTDPNRERELQPEGGIEDFREWVGDGIDLLTGGFPCQPFSAAGRRRGTEDDRHLWPEMLRLIRETNPTFVLGENVGGLLTWDGGMVLEMVIADLESAGYEAGAFVIPACAVGAPHRRDRVWIAANSISKRTDRRNAGEYEGASGEERIQERDEVEQPSVAGTLWHVADPSSNRRERRGTTSAHEEGHETRPSESGELERGLERPHSDASDTTIERLQGFGDEVHEQRQESDDELTDGRDRSGNPSDVEDTERERPRGGSDGDTGGNDGEIQAEGSSAALYGWEEHWITAATELCAMDDGLPDGLARPRGWRNAALKGAGNAIVPQVAAQVLRAMKNA